MEDPTEPASEDAADPHTSPAPSAGERPSATGEPRVDAALARLAELEGLPVTEHRAVFEDVHRRLSDVLGELDAGQAPEAGRAAAQPARPAQSARPGRPGR
jgi:hypothetical protein